MKPLDDFRVKPDKKLKLANFDPSAKPRSCGDKPQDLARIEELAERIDTLQELLYANRKQRLLVVLQGMDTSGKDGTVRGVFSRTDPLGVRAVGFKAPTPAEAEHDFLWRIHQQTPGAGEIVIFNRSHYEDVLITRVNGWIDDKEAVRRFAYIRQFEQLLIDASTNILKCYLHISKDEQKNRLQARLADPSKHWKFDPNDLIARKSWDAYQSAYEAALPDTSTVNAPWYVIPANSKTHRNLMIAELVIQTLEGMKLKKPGANPAFANIKIK